MLLIKIIFISLFSFVFCIGAVCIDEPYVSAESAVVMNTQTLEVFYEKKAQEVRSMASTTKIMTALLACESGNLDSIVTAKEFAAEGTSIGLKEGDKLRLRDMVYAMMLESGNDAARLTATFLAGSEEKFARLMNEKAEKIGMKNTNFVTASGLDAEEHYTTAYDMALLGAEAINNEMMRKIMSEKSYTASFILPEKKVTFYNHNKLLGRCNGVFGIKTGFTKKSGRCLVTACVRDGITFVAVTLRAPDDWNDHERLYNYAYKTVKTETIDITSFADMISVCGGNKSGVSFSFCNENFLLPYQSYPNHTVKIYTPMFLYAPVKKGDIIGRAELIVAGRMVAQTDIYCCESIDSVKVKEKIRIIEFLKKVFDFRKE